MHLKVQGEGRSLEPTPKKLVITIPTFEVNNLLSSRLQIRLK